MLSKARRGGHKGEQRVPHISVWQIQYGAPVRTADEKERGLQLCCVGR